MLGGDSLIYEAKTQTFLMQLLVALGIVGMISTKGITGMDVILIIGIIVLLSLHYKFQIDEKSLSYQIFLLSIPIYKKEVVPKQINEIKFIRVGWIKKVRLFGRKKV